MVERILNKVRELQNEPRPVGSKKLRGSLGLWRLRVGDYRVVYEIL
ncbi:MAG: type II toxin-antitoxin system RelE family toxin [Limisphaerales bacterium]